MFHSRKSKDYTKQKHEEMKIFNNRDKSREKVSKNVKSGCPKNKNREVRRKGTEYCYLCYKPCEITEI